MKKLEKQLAQDLLSNLRLLADQLARKPKVHTKYWAKSITDSFKMYTRTNTVNYFLSVNEMLHEKGWPFPAYLDLEKEMKSIKGSGNFNLSLIMGKISLGEAMLYFSLGKSESKNEECADLYLCKRFRKVAKSMFVSWQTHPLLQKKNKILIDVYLSYKKRLWGVCIPSILPLLDFLIRDYFHSNDLRVSVDTLVNAFKLAGITSEGLKPGYGISTSLEKNPNELMIADNVEKDLRLPGIYLVSFVDFAQRYYSWHTSVSEPKELNRHAIAHGDMNYCSEVNTTKFLMFFDLTLKLEPVLRIVIGTVQRYNYLLSLNKDN